ncbi:MAG: polysaccharide biosynthesis C-terminal domain-containing protein, partial [Gemmatimonadetes bacterium]|nr:polysaccharide biosynthesis C-terminal domain-containing protein [Gemmatimonadota bacterium]
FNAKLMGEGYPSMTLWAPGIALAANVALNLWLIPKLGLRGAALSTSLAYALWGVLTASYYLRLNQLGWRAVFVLPLFGQAENPPTPSKESP